MQKPQTNANGLELVIDVITLIIDDLMIKSSLNSI